jgi:hypothetical protein
LKQEKEDALKKLQGKNADDEEANYKHLLEAIPKGSILAQETPDHVYELAANIIDPLTIGQDELLAHKQVIRISNSTAVAKPASVAEKVKTSVKKVIKEEVAPVAKVASADSADDFDNI